MDAASESARLGAREVTLAYRRSQAEMSGYAFEYELAKSAGVKGLFNVAPVEIQGKDHVEGVSFVRTSSNGGKLEEIPGSTFTIPCDAVILATGQSKYTELLTTIGGIDVNADGAILTNRYGQSSNLKYFTGGDAMNGGAEVVNAAADGKRAAVGIDRFLSEEG